MSPSEGGADSSRQALWVAALWVAALWLAAIGLYSEGNAHGEEVPTARVGAPPAATKPSTDPSRCRSDAAFSGEILQLPVLGLGALSAGAISAEGRLLAVGDRGGYVALIDLVDRRMIRTERLHQGEVRALAFRDHSLVTGGEDGRVLVWNLSELSSLSSPRVLRARGAPIRDIALSSRHFAVAAEQPAIELYALEDLRLVRLLRGHSGWVRTLAFARSGRRLASGGHDGQIRIWSPDHGVPQRTLKGHTLWVSALAFGASDDELASAGFDQRVYLWRLGTAAPLRRFDGHIREVIDLAFDRDGLRLASASLDRTGLVWDVSSGKRLARLAGHGYQVSAVMYAPWGQLITASGDGYVRLWSWPPTPPVSVADLPPLAYGELTLRHNTTGERLRLRLLDRKKRLLPSGLRALARMMRSSPDCRTAMPDAKLARLLYQVAERFGRTREIVLVSGYRSPEYNGLRRKQSREVAEQSQHMRAQAIDFRIEGITITALQQYVSSLKAGGVGLYPDSQFVHMDTGPVRQWKGM